VGETVGGEQQIVQFLIDT